MRKVAVAFLLLLTTCGGDGLMDPPANSIGQFLRAEGLTRINSLDYVAISRSNSATVFRARFGKQDCPSGCIPYTMFGLEFRDRIGWLGEQSGGLRQNATFFDFLPDDAYLYSTEFFGIVPRDYEAAWSLIESMTRDSDTSVEGLINLVGLIEVVGLPGHAMAVLDHPKAVASRPVLQAIAAMRDSSLSDFTRARDEANQRLAALPQA